MLKADFHSHTNYIQPQETTHSPKQLIDRAAELKFDVLCFSEHYVFTEIADFFPVYKKDPLQSYRDFRVYAASKGILLIPAVEARYKEGEALLINFTGDIRKYPTIESLKNLPESVLVIAPHPFFKRDMCLGKNLEKHINLFDAIEYSHFYLPFLNLNKKAVKLALKRSLPLVGTSDAHHLCQLGHTYTLINAKKDIKSIVKAVRERKVRIVSRRLPYSVFLKLAIIHFARMFSALYIMKIRRKKPNAVK
ncbi:MAG: PHP domain-containing protein [Candidatus Nanoarchaeia archaeon]|nr:PHP domain-containing protein [Candidatus Nanoarchaeia archaeon]